VVRDVNSEEKKSSAAKAARSAKTADNAGENNFSAAKTLDADINAHEGKQSSTTF
jgi:hypothetical protein